MLSKRKEILQSGGVAALAGAYIQFIVVIAILFLPIIPSYDSGSVRYMPLIFWFRPDTSLGSYLLTFIEFALAILPGALAISAIRRSKIGPLTLYCLLGGYTGLAVGYMNWVWGAYFCPGALFMLLAAVLLMFAHFN